MIDDEIRKHIAIAKDVPIGVSPGKWDREKLDRFLHANNPALIIGLCEELLRLRNALRMIGDSQTDEIGLIDGISPSKIAKDALE